MDKTYRKITKNIFFNTRKVRRAKQFILRLSVSKTATLVEDGFRGEERGRKYVGLMDGLEVAVARWASREHFPIYIIPPFTAKAKPFRVLASLNKTLNWNEGVRPSVLLWGPRFTFNNKNPLLRYVMLEGTLNNRNTFKVISFTYIEVFILIIKHTNIWKLNADIFCTKSSDHFGLNTFVPSFCGTHFLW